MNHRSDEFMKLCRQTVTLLKDRLGIPASYEIFFTTSATECWEVIAQSIVKEESVHIYNGAFGEKWYEYTKKLKPKARAVPFDIDAVLQPVDMGSGDVICITQNETSNGTQVDPKIIKAIRNSNPGCLVAVDATSSMAGIALDFGSADVWFASVQKCFGLPAGLAVLACSPDAIQRIKQLGERAHYNSLTYVREMMGKYQTNCTPNVLGIYLLMRVLRRHPSIKKVDLVVKGRANDWFNFFKKSKQLSFLSHVAEVRSDTVMAIAGSEEHIQLIKEKARKKGFLLGEGYGPLKKYSFRIANFPALRKDEIRKLRKFLRDYL